jgi:hypothetical protein
VHTITLKRRLNGLVDYFPLKERMVKYFVKVDMTNPIQLVAVATALLM